MMKVLIVLALLVGGIIPPASAQTPAPFVNLGAFSIVIESLPGDLDPASSYDENSNIPMRGLYEGLVRLKGESLTELEPVLAESYTVTDNRVFTFKLRQNVKFHDGTPFNATAAKFGLTRTLKSGLATAGILGTFITDPDKMITFPNEATLVITLPTPQPLFLSALAASYGTGMVSPTAVKNNSSTQDPIAHDWLLRNGAGTGPYRLEKTLTDDPTQPVVLRRFEGYWRGWSGPHFDQITMQVQPQSALRRRSLEVGSADAATFLLPDDLRKLEKIGGFSLNNKAETLRLDYLIMAAGYGPLKNPKARQAMGYAFDYTAYNRAELGGLGRQPNGPFPNKLFGARADTFTYKLDLQRAKTLLAEAKVPAGTRFVLAAPEGRGDLAGAILKQGLEQIGYFLEIKKYSNEAYQELLIAPLTPDRPDFFIQSWWPDYNSPLNFALPIFASESAGENGQNAGYYQNARIDQIIAAGKTAKSLNELNTLFTEFQKIIAQDDPAGIYMVQPVDRTALRGQIKGHVFNVLYLATFDFYALYE
jgi:peptide/nickel transport system substrate-binding protein